MPRSKWTNSCRELDPSSISQGGTRRPSYTIYGMDSRSRLIIWEVMRAKDKEGFESGIQGKMKRKKMWRRSARRDPQSSMYESGTGDRDSGQ